MSLSEFRMDSLADKYEEQAEVLREKEEKEDDKEKKGKGRRIKSKTKNK